MIDRWERVPVSELKRGDVVRILANESDLLEAQFDVVDAKRIPFTKCWQVDTKDRVRNFADDYLVFRMVRGEP